MILNLRLIKVDSNYCDYLRKFDYRVPYNKDKKELRPFVGILFTIDSKEYYAPLSSPKSKYLKMKNTIDFLKIDKGYLGAINFNNMIPVREQNYEIVDLNKRFKNKTKIKYNELLKSQLTWLNENLYQIKNKSKKLYEYYLNNRLSKNIVNRCCNYELLEEKCEEYNKQTIR